MARQGRKSKSIVVCLIVGAFAFASGLLVIMNLRSSLALTATATAEGTLTSDLVPMDALRGVAIATSESCNTLCDCLLKGTLKHQDVIPTSVSLWKRYSSKVLEASIRLDDAPNNTHDYRIWVQHLFSWTTPSRLVKSFETYPQDLASLSSLYTILQKRFDQPSTSQPLKVAVFGGSLTAGHGCLENPLGMASQSFLKRQLPCAWPARVQNLLDAFAPGLVNITNIAMAATTSDVGATVVDYQLWPPELMPDGPDVIVASFAVNDALAEAPETEIYQNMQLLIESIERERNCRADKLPLLIYVDDFIAWPGPVQKWLDFHHDLHELADWHGVGYISYANAFRDLVYADLMQDSTFKGKWTREKRKLAANPHPGMSFHLLMSWIFSYNLLHLGLHMCDGSLEEATPPQHATFSVASIPSVQRPPLEPDLLTEDIPTKWREREVSEQKRCASISSGPRCGFVWVANRVSEFRTAKAIEEFLKGYLTAHEDWKAEGNSYRSKHGWVAKKEKARFELDIPSMGTPVRYLTILSLKSYGTEWEGSKLRVKVAERELFIEGFHNSTTSVIVPHKFDLGKTMKKGSSLKIIFDLVGGSTFKITGMALCAQ